MTSQKKNDKKKKNKIKKKKKKNVQCRNSYVNHWEAQPPYIANYKFSSTEHGE